MKAKVFILLIGVVLCLAFLLENLKVQRALFGLALILLTSLLWRTAVRLRNGPVRPGGAQTVQRTGASRFAQRQIQYRGRLAPAADLRVGA